MKLPCYSILLVKLPKALARQLKCPEKPFKEGPGYGAWFGPLVSDGPWLSQCIHHFQFGNPSSFILSEIPDETRLCPLWFTALYSSSRTILFCNSISIHSYLENCDNPGSLNHQILITFTASSLWAGIPTFNGLLRSLCNVPYTPATAVILH